MPDKLSKYLKEYEKEADDKDTTNYYDEMIDQWKSTKKDIVSVVAELRRKYLGGNHKLRLNKVKGG